MGAVVKLARRRTALASTASGFAALVLTSPASDSDAGPSGQQTLSLAALDASRDDEAPTDHLTLIARDGPLLRLYLGKPARIGNLATGATPRSEHGSEPRLEASGLGAMDGAFLRAAVAPHEPHPRAHRGDGGHVGADPPLAIYWRLRGAVKYRVWFL